MLLFLFLFVVVNGQHPGIPVYADVYTFNENNIEKAIYFFEKENGDPITNLNELPALSSMYRYLNTSTSTCINFIVYDNFISFKPIGSDPIISCDNNMMNFYMYTGKDCVNLERTIQNTNNYFEPTFTIKGICGPVSSNKYTDKSLEDPFRFIIPNQNLQIVIQSVSSYIPTVFDSSLKSEIFFIRNDICSQTSRNTSIELLNISCNTTHTAKAYPTPNCTGPFTESLYTVIGPGCVIPSSSSDVFSTAAMIGTIIGAVVFFFVIVFLIWRSRRHLTANK